MSRRDARIGDTGSHGGAIVTGARSVICENQPTSRIGDIYLCPIHGPNPIVTGSPKEIVENSPTARIGDITACGAVIVSGAARKILDS